MDLAKSSVGSRADPRIAHMVVIALLVCASHEIYGQRAP